MTDWSPQVPLVDSVTNLILIDPPGSILVLAILIACVVIRRRHQQHSGIPSYKKRRKDQSEFELQPCMSGSSGYLLAFDNPYYDVLAAMGLYDDVEEDFYNPLYDDVSMGSDAEDGCQKGLSAMVVR